jgi:hypothetical protein
MNSKLMWYSVRSKNFKSEESSVVVKEKFLDVGEAILFLA